MPHTATCSTCGTVFEVPDSLRERYPGWTPSRCRGCHDADQRAARTNGSADGRRRAGSRTTRRGGAEGQFSPAEVLEHFTDGPLSGVFTDGSADPNPGPGGWGAVHVRDDQIVGEAHGHEPHTTNNRMELTALIAGFDLVPEGEAATVYSDSNYCVRMINEWAAGWERNGWRRKDGPVKNLDLVQQLYERAQARPELELRWIKAHDGSRWNEYADALSVAYRRD
ncbi:MAG TPA: ribonuclease H [Euzebyales bacterium]|nr:ribonuclease H [Euzebyales bacterium]